MCTYAVPETIRDKKQDSTSRFSLLQNYNIMNLFYYTTSYYTVVVAFMDYVLSSSCLEPLSFFLDGKRYDIVRFISNYSCCGESIKWKLAGGQIIGT